MTGQVAPLIMLLLLSQILQSPHQVLLQKGKTYRFTYRFKPGELTSEKVAQIADGLKKSTVGPEVQSVKREGDRLLVVRKMARDFLTTAQKTIDLVGHQTFFESAKRT